MKRFALFVAATLAVLAHAQPAAADPNACALVSLADAAKVLAGSGCKNHAEHAGPAA